MLLKRIASWISLIGYVNSIPSETNSTCIRLEYGGKWLTIEGDDLNDTNVDELLGSLNNDQIKKIETINLDRKGLTRVPLNIKKFYNLEFLYLCYNQITTIDCGAFEGLNKLKLLKISDNNLTTIGNRAFEGLKSLKTLDLNNNKLMTIESRTFYDLNDLKIISLMKNHLAIIKEEAFVELPSLQIINLNNNQLTTINRDVFVNVPNLSILTINDNQLAMIDSSVFEVLENLERLSLQNNRLSALPDSILGLNQPHITIDIQDNPDFSAESGDGTLGLEGLRRAAKFEPIFDQNQHGKLLLLNISMFIDEYSKRESLHWNLDKLKELKLPAAKDSSLSMDKMLEIVDKIFPVEYKSNSLMGFIRLILSKLKKPTPKSDETMIKENVKNYIKRIHGQKTRATRWEYPMIDEKDFPTAIKLLSNILEHLEKLVDDGNEDTAKANLAVLSNGMTECSHGQIAALNDAYALINGDYESGSDDIVGILKHRIAVWKDLKFRLLVTPPESAHNVHILNYWMNRLKDILGFTVNLNVEVKDSQNGDPFKGDPNAVLRSFLDGVFTPDKIVDKLTKDINKNREMKNAFLSFICKDNALLSLLLPNKEFAEDEDVLNPDSVLYQMDMTKDVVEHVLIKMNLLIGNSDDNSVRN